MTPEPLGGLDSAFLASDALAGSSTSLQMGLVLVVDPPAGGDDDPAGRFAVVRRTVADRVHLFPRLRQRPVAPPLGLGRPVWVDDPEFELDDHMSRTCLPAPAGQSELWQLVGAAMSEPLPRHRPLWEMVVVEGMGEGRTALVLKLHHAVLDGGAAIEAFSAFLDASPEQAPAPAGAVWEPETPPTGWEPVRRLLGDLAREPSRAVGVLLSATRAAVAVAARNADRERRGRALPPLPFAAPRTSWSGTVSQQRRFAWLTIADDDLAEVQHAFGVTVNETMLTAVAGGLQRLLELRSEPAPSRPLTALVPVSTRQGGHGDWPGNQLSAMVVSLATQIEDPVERLEAVAASNRSAKEQALLIGHDLLERAAAAVPPAVVAGLARAVVGLAAFDRLPPAVNVTVSCLRGPEVPLWCAGARVAALYPVGPVATPVALNVSVMSAWGSHFVGILGCQRLAPDVTDLARLVGEAMGELAAAARERGTPGTVT